MKYLFFLLWFCTVFFFSCNDGLPDAEEADGEIEIFPDYKEVAIPCNIAPLNFKLKEPCEAIALFSGEGLQIRVDSDNGSFQIPEKKWRMVSISSFFHSGCQRRNRSLFGLSPYCAGLPDVEQDGDLPALPGRFYGRNFSRQ